MVRIEQIAFISFNPPKNAESKKTHIAKLARASFKRRNENKNKETITLSKWVFAELTQPQISQQPSNNKKYKVAVNTNEKRSCDKNEISFCKNV